MKKNTKQIWGILLIILAVLLTSTHVYTFVKSIVVDSGGSIWLSITVAWGLIIASLISGILLLKNS